MRYRGFYINYKLNGRGVGYWVARKYVSGTRDSSIVCSGNTSWECMNEVDKIIEQEEESNKEKEMNES